MDTIVLQIKYAESQYDLCYEMCYLEEYAQCLRNDTGDKMFNEAGHDSGKLTQLARNAWRAVLNLLSRILEKIADWMRWGAKKTQNRGPEIVEIPEVYASKKNRGKLKQIVAQIKKVVNTRNLAIAGAVIATSVTFMALYRNHQHDIYRRTVSMTRSEADVIMREMNTNATGLTLICKRLAAYDMRDPVTGQSIPEYNQRPIRKAILQQAAKTSCKDKREMEAVTIIKHLRETIGDLGSVMFDTVSLILSLFPMR